MSVLLNVPHPHDDAISLSMFWAGVLMVFTPVIFAAVVLGVWWWQRRVAGEEVPPGAPPS